MGGLMFDRETVDAVAADIVMWTNFYIIVDEESIGLARDFQNRLDDLNISSIIIGEGQEYDFEDWDCLLAISSTGDDETVLDAVRVAKSRNVKVYGLCTDLKSTLVQLCDECIFAENYGFGDDVKEFLDLVLEEVESQLEDEDYDLVSASYLGSSKRVFIVCEYGLLAYARKLGKKLVLRTYSPLIITEDMKDKFKDSLKKDNMVVAVSNHDDGFVVEMVKFAKSMDVFVLGCGFVYCENLMRFCDTFNPLSKEDAEKCDLDYSKFRQASLKNEETEISGKSGIGVIVLSLIFIAIVLLAWWILK